MLYFLYILIFDFRRNQYWSVRVESQNQPADIFESTARAVIVKALQIAAELI